MNNPDNDRYYEEGYDAPNFTVEKVSMDERRDAELLEQLESIESGTKLEILEKLVGDK